LAIEKTDQTIALAQWKGAQDNGFRLLEWHSFSDWLYAEPTPVVGAPTGGDEHASEIARRILELRYLPYQEARRN